MNEVDKAFNDGAARVGVEVAALRAQVEELAREREAIAETLVLRVIELRQAEAKLAQVVEALERIVAIAPDVAQRRTHVVAIKRLAEAALAAAREQPTQEKPGDRR